MQKKKLNVAFRRFQKTPPNKQKKKKKKREREREREPQRKGASEYAKDRAKKMEDAVARVEASLERIERAVANIDARVAVNEELARRNVALTGHVAPEPPAQTERAPGERSVRVRLGAETVSVIANACTFEMRSELKRARASWQADAPPRWCVSRAAWDENCEAWRTQFGLAYAFEAETPSPTRHEIDTHSASLFTAE